MLERPDGGIEEQVRLLRQYGRLAHRFYPLIVEPEPLVLVPAVADVMSALQGAEVHDDARKIIPTGLVGNKRETSRCDFGRGVVGSTCKVPVVGVFAVPILHSSCVWRHIQLQRECDPYGEFPKQGVGFVFVALEVDAKGPG